MKRIFALLLALLLALPVMALAEEMDAPVVEVEEFVIGEEAAPESAEETAVAAPEVAGDGAVDMGVEPMAIGQINLVNVKDNGEITLTVGETRQIVPTFATANGWTVTEYKSSKDKYVTVSSTGVVMAVAEGKAKITVKTNGKKATVKIKVVDPYKPDGIAITQGKELTLSVGQSVKLGTALTPSTARATLEWKTSKDKYVTVDGSGTVRAIAEGKAKISVKTHNGKKASIKIKVVDPYKPDSIAITQGKEITLTVGQSVRLNAVLTPSTARTTLEWKTSKDKYVTVDGSGLIRAVGKGSAKITVKTANGKKATIKVKVDGVSNRELYALYEKAAKQIEDMEEIETIKYVDVNGDGIDEAIVLGHSMDGYDKMIVSVLTYRNRTVVSIMMDLEYGLYGLKLFMDTQSLTYCGCGHGTEREYIWRLKGDKFSFVGQRWRESLSSGGDYDGEWDCYDGNGNSISLNRYNELRKECLKGKSITIYYD